MGDVDDIKDLPENYNIEFPTEYSAYIEVIYEKDEPYFDYDGWRTIIVFMGGFFMAFPFIAILCIIRRPVKKCWDNYRA